ncbi:MAG: GNAT family N-acetyltransferase [Capsulimonadaceae bacterium]
MSSTGIETRPLTQNDVESFREIRLEGLLVNPEAFGRTLDSERELPLSRFADRLNSNSGVIGAFDRERILGIAGWEIGQAKRAHIGKLWGMYVRPAARGHGVGRRLVQAVIDIARDRIEVLELSVVAGNGPAHRLYESSGFVEYGREKKAFKQDGVYYDMILMALDLDPVEGAGRATYTVQTSDVDPSILAACVDIRRQVFVDEQRVPLDIEMDDLDEGALHFLLTDASGVPVATARLLDHRPEAKIGRMAVLREFRGQSAGSRLMMAVLDAARARGYSEAVLSAQVSALPFYEKMGFLAESPVYDEAGIPHRRMRLRL